MKRIRPLLILLIVAGLAAGGYWLSQSRATPGPGEQGPFTEITTVRRGDVRETLTVAGTLDAVKRKELQFEKSQRGTPLKTLLVGPGDTVSKGDVVATIDPVPFEQALELARVNLQRSEEVLARLNRPSSELDRSRADLGIAKAELALAGAEEALVTVRKPDLTDLRAKVAAGETALAEARKALQDLQADPDYAEGLRQWREREQLAGAEQARLARESYTDVYHEDRLRVARNELADATDGRISFETDRTLKLRRQQSAVGRAERDLATARKALSSAEAGPGGSPEAAQALAQAELDVVEAKVALNNAREARTRLDKGPDPVELAAAQSEVEQLRLEVKDAEAALQQAELVAPFDGTVLTAPVPAGGSVGPTVTVVTLADVTQLQVTAWVDEALIRRLAIGQRGQVTFEALPFETFGAQVKSVPLQGKIDQGVRTFFVPFELDDPTGLPPQMGISASIELELGSAEGVLLVPAMAVEPDGPDNIVLRPNPEAGGEPIPVTVKVGLSDGIDTEIVSGLNEGDEILIPMEGVPDGRFGARLAPANGAERGTA